MRNGAERVVSHVVRKRTQARPQTESAGASEEFEANPISTEDVSAPAKLHGFVRKSLARNGRFAALRIEGDEQSVAPKLDPRSLRRNVNFNVNERPANPFQASGKAAQFGGTGNATRRALTDRRVASGVGEDGVEAHERSVLCAARRRTARSRADDASEDRPRRM